MENEGLSLSTTKEKWMNHELFLFLHKWNCVNVVLYFLFFALCIGLFQTNLSI